MINEESTLDQISSFNRGIVQRNPAEFEFHQAVQEFTESVMPFVKSNSKYDDGHILHRMTEPDRIIIFRVCWEDDSGHINCNRAWRVQFNNSIGPYKGGLRFHPSVTQSVLKFLGFEQTFKNALTGLPMGGAKGGSDFNPKGKSDREIMRFCQSLMIELSKYIGEDTDIPAGDIGVGGREISYLFGQYKKLTGRFVGTLTGKGLSYGGSLIRTEATGYGVIYFTGHMLGVINETLKGKKALVSGSGNVAIFCAEKLIDEGAKVLTLSDSGGFIHDPDGIDQEKLEWLKDLKFIKRGRISEYVNKYPNAKFYKDERPWKIKADLAFPCATQNELDKNDAKNLIENNILLVSEGANMPSTLDAAKLLQDAGVIFAPAKAANAGGVAVSGLEQSQNALRIPWSREEVDGRLKQIMEHIHKQCVEYGSTEEKSINYVKGANIAGFVKVADAMLAYGIG
ncbi:MAG: NADP-specific glutamate dehydrogenase [Halobacteriovoraceae bacterium]|nr:NADP-specific glutamate dehydrogenase [Halobacteriovoraceae bacterium]|tara:strand:- start:1125 stop:2486 length:1362 start_codon:yes stop_codon:yes gene_type:complete